MVKYLFEETIPRMFIKDIEKYLKENVFVQILTVWSYKNYFH